MSTILHMPIEYVLFIFLIQLSQKNILHFNKIGRSPVNQAVCSISIQFLKEWFNSKFKRDYFFVEHTHNTKVIKGI